MKAWPVLLLLIGPVAAETVPRSPAGEALAAEIAAQGIETVLTYAEAAEPVAKRVVPPPQPPAQPVPIAPWVVLLVLAAALLLWLRFGGAGVLTRRAPAEGTSPTVPEAWAVEAAQAPETLLDQIGRMEDRRAALVRLLRHCLLTAAEQSRTAFARSDTERRAFDRLPASWRAHEALARILQAAELAHYGGRPVDDAGFGAALAAGRQILGGRHA